MTEGAGPAAQRPKKPGVREMLSAAAALMRDYPRETMLPFLAINTPLVLGTVVVTVLLYSSVFADEVYPRGGITGAEGRGQVFALVLVLVLGAILAAVAQGATIVSVAAVARGRSLPVSEALDPAFTRLGGLIALSILFTVGAGLLAFTIVGLLALPYLIGRLGVTFQVYLLEGTGPLEAIARSWQVMHGNMLRLLGIFLLAVALFVLLGALVPVSPEPGSMAREARMAIDAGVQILQGGIAIPLTVFAHAAVTLYYLRIREETS